MDIMCQPNPTTPKTGILSVRPGVDMLMMAIKMIRAPCYVTVLFGLHNALVVYHPIITSLAFMASDTVLNVL